MKLLTVLYAGPTSTPAKTKENHQRLLYLLGALQTPADICLYGATEDVERVAPALAAPRLYLLPTETEAPGPLAEALAGLVQKEGYEGIALASENGAAEVAVLLAQQCGYSTLTQVEAVQVQQGQMVCTRPVYSNNLLGRYFLPGPFVISCQLPDNTGPAGPLPNAAEVVPLPACGCPPHIIKRTLISAGQEKPPSPVLLVAGMGVSRREDLNRLRCFSAEKGFDFGVTRPVAMRGWAGAEEIVGVSGRLFAPKITVALGVSGAAAFFVGVEKSGYILSVNVNPEATIARQSNAVIVDDYANVLEGLMEKLTPYQTKRGPHE